MRIYKDTPFELTLMPWELEPPKTTVLLVVKATFELTDEVCTLASEQVPCLGEVPWDDGGSLRTEGDYALIKPEGEWYLTGTACAPAPATIVPVTVRVGELQKRLAVWGDRRWQRGLLGSRPSEPEPFTSMPLRWERSFGGPAFEANPVGRGIEAVETATGPALMLPNIEGPAHPIVSREARPAPAGMFAIPGTWPARAARTGTYDELWKRSRWPFLPKDFDFAFYNCAPADQRRQGFWRGDEVLELSGLSPTRPRIATRLPGLRARVFIEPASASNATLHSRRELLALGAPKLAEVPLVLDTIVLDTDAGHVMCQWRGLASVEDARLSSVGRIFVAHEALDAPLPVAHYEERLLAKLLEEADEDEDETARGELALAMPSSREEEPPSELESAIASFEAAMMTFLEALRALQPEVAPTVEHVRAKYTEAGLDAEALLPEPERPELPEDALHPSVLRLAAIVRKKLGRSFRDFDLSDMPFQRLDLSGVDFSESILTGASLAHANLEDACFDGAILARADLTGARADGASFRDADVSELRAAGALLRNTTFDGAGGSDVDLRDANLHSASLVGAELERCDLTNAGARAAMLDGADLAASILDGADFTGSSLNDASLEGARAHGTIFDRCKMADLRASDGADLTRAQLVMVDAPRAQLQGAILVDANLSGANLEDADLEGARGARVSLVRALLRRARLDRADLFHAQLMQADLFEASLEEAVLRYADARGAHLFSAHLWRARTDDALLEGAVLDRTVLERTVLGG